MAKTKLTMLVLGVRQRDMTFSDGRNLQDCVVSGISDSDEVEGLKGYLVEENKGAYELYAKFPTVPGRYELTTDWNGKKMTVLDAKLLEKVELKL